MNREIKFRIRLERINSVEYADTFCTIYVPLSDEKNGLLEFPIELDVWKILSIEQYTGLKDCNGKEIYEGEYDDTEDDYISIVVFKEGTFGVDHYGACERGEIDFREFVPFAKYYIDDFDFTKNIHENPIEGEFV
jgi:hypothetical protein